jgi:hypothetical protein
MQSTGSIGALTPRSLVHDGAEFCEELVRRGGRALTIPFAGRRMVISFEWLLTARAPRAQAIAPEFDDVELARIAARSGAPAETAWDRSLTLQYGGIRRS